LATVHERHTQTDRQDSQTDKLFYLSSNSNIKILWLWNW